MLKIILNKKGMKGKVIRYGSYFLYAMFVACLFVGFSFNLHAQNKISGTVTDAKSGDPLPGVNILVVGTATGTATDINGQYSLNVLSLKDSLRFSFIGYQTQTVPVNGRTTIDIQMKTTIVTSGNQLVVVGYGTQKRSNVAGSMTSVNTQQIQEQPVTNFEQSLQGKIPGVHVHYNTGEPGAPMQVQIRGVGTFGNSNPLYIVDGIPMQSEDMASLNPDDIKSMEVLKDASAAAIYGSRAANGVVLIETKTGQKGKIQLDYNGYVGLQSFTNFIPMLNSQQYADVVNESTAASGLTPDPAYNDPDNLKHSTNWQRAAFRLAPMTSHTARISGGGENVTYSVGGNYMSQEGIMVFNNLKRYSANIKTKFDVTDKLTVGESLILDKLSGLNRNTGFNLDFTYMLGGSPTMRIYNPENLGGYAGPNPKQTGINNRDNVIERRDLRRVYGKTDRLLGNFYVEYNFLPGLKDRFSYGLRAHRDKSKAFVPVFQAGNRSNSTASLTDTREEHSHTLLQDLLTYQRDIGKNFSIRILGGYSQEVDLHSNFSGFIQDFPSSRVQVIDAGTGNFTIGGNKSKYTLRSYFSRAHLTLFNKYLFTATYRRDGSSRFGEDQKYGNFPSVAIGWVMSREKFMKNIPWLSNLKLRADWGQLGNQDIAEYANGTYVTTGQRYILGDQFAPGAAVISVGNPKIRWETTTETDVGFNMAIFNNELTFTGDYYIKSTDDILVRPPISVATGIDRGNGPFENEASMKNTGIELGLTYSKSLDNFNYTLSGNISTVKNKVTSLGNQNSIINFVTNAYNYGVYTITKVGEPVSSFYGWIDEGIFQDQQEIDNHAKQVGAKPGDVIFKDINHDGIISSDDRTIIGNPFPNFVYGFSANINYHRFNFVLAIHGVQGRRLYDAQKALLENLDGQFNQRKAVLKRWHGKGTSNSIPRATRADPNNNSRPSTRFVENASYLKIQDLRFGYTFSQSMVNNVGLRKFKIYLDIQNLLTITKYPGYSPDIRGGSGSGAVEDNPLSVGVDLGTYPVPRVYELGIQLGF